MSLKIVDNFLYRGNKPLDARLIYNTTAEMIAAVDYTLYDGLIAFNKEEQSTFIYNSANTVDPTYGKWKKFISANDKEDLFIELTKTEFEALEAAGTIEQDQVYLITGYDESTAVKDIPTSNLINSSSTDDTYPTSKAVYDALGDFYDKYYAKPETYSREEILFLMKKIKRNTNVVVQVLPAVANLEEGITYWVGDDTNGYRLYTYINEKVLDLGNASESGVINNGNLIIQRNGNNIGSFTANSASDKTIDIKSPVIKVNESETETKIYAPTTSGEVGQVLISKGEGQEPEWVEYGGDSLPSLGIPGYAALTVKFNKSSDYTTGKWNIPSVSGKTNGNMTLVRDSLVTYSGHTYMITAQITDVRVPAHSTVKGVLGVMEGNTFTSDLEPENVTVSGGDYSRTMGYYDNTTDEEVTRTFTICTLYTPPAGKNAAITPLLQFTSGSAYSYGPKGVSYMSVLQLS